MIKFPHIGTRSEIAILIIFAISIIVGTFMHLKTYNSLISVRNDSIAQVFTHEGIETVDKTLGFNLIKYKDSKCWNFDLYNQSLPCGPDKRLEGKYRLEFNPEINPFFTFFDMKLVKVDEDFILGSGENQRLNEKYIISQQPINEGRPTAIPFYRMVEIKYNDFIGKKNELIAISHIGWVERGVVETRSLSMAFYNSF